MAVRLDLTEKMIESFNECTRKGNYEKVVNENQEFIRTLCEKLKTVKFQYDNTLPYMISQNLSFYLNYLTQYNPQSANCFVHNVKALERFTPSLTDSMKCAITIRNWNNFYSEYSPTVDYMINTARKQKILDFQIQYGSGAFDTFEVRDLVASTQNHQSQNYLDHENYHSGLENDVTDSRNNRGMIKYEGKEADDYRSAHQNLYEAHLACPVGENNTIYSNDIGVTTFRVPGTVKSSQNGSRINEKSSQDAITSHNQEYSESLLNPQRNASSLRNYQIVIEPPPRTSDNSRTKFTASSGDRFDLSPGIPLYHNQEPNLSCSQYSNSTNPKTYGRSSVAPGPEPQKFTSVKDLPQFVNLGSSQQVSSSDSFLPSNSSNSHVRNIEPKKPSKEYHPALSADQELKSLRRPESLDHHSDTDSTNQAILNYRDDMASATEISLRTGFKPVFHSNTPKNDSIRERRQCRDSPLSDNSLFDRQLAEQKIRNDIELENKREERKKKQKVFEDELRKLKEESKKRFEMLLKCILARHRFEIQEEHWMDWIHGCRQNIIQLLNRWNDFADEVEREHKGFRRPEKIDHQDLQNHTGYFLNSIMVVYDILQFDFEKLEEVERTYPDTLFVRVLMKCIADVAGELLEVYCITENLGSDRSKYSKLQQEMSKIRQDSIYSTSRLRSVCRTATPSNYSNITFPVMQHNVKIQELY